MRLSAADYAAVPARARMNQTSGLISVTEITRTSPSNPPRMQADISSENSSATARPSRSKSFSTERVRWFPSQLHIAFLCHVRLAKLAVIRFAPSAPKAGGTPSHCNTVRHQAMETSYQSNSTSRAGIPVTQICVRFETARVYLDHPLSRMLTTIFAEAALHPQCPRTRFSICSTWAIGVSGRMPWPRLKISRPRA